MPKFTRTVYASGSLRSISTDIAYQAHLDGAVEQHYGELYQRAAKGRKRVRITILVEALPPAPKVSRKPGRPRPVQLRMPLHVADGAAT